MLTRVLEGELLERNPFVVEIGGRPRPATLDDKLKKASIVLYPGRRVQCIRVAAHVRIIGIEATAKEYLRLCFPKMLWKAGGKVMPRRERHWYPAESPVPWIGPIARAYFESSGFAVQEIDLSQFGAWEPYKEVSPLYADQVLLMDEVWVAVWCRGVESTYFAATPERYEYDSLEPYEDEWEGAAIVRTALWHAGLRRPRETQRHVGKVAKKPLVPELVLC